MFLGSILISSANGSWSLLAIDTIINKYQHHHYSAYTINHFTTALSYDLILNNDFPSIHVPQNMPLQLPISLQFKNSVITIYTFNSITEQETEIDKKA